MIDKFYYYILYIDNLFKIDIYKFHMNSSFNFNESQTLFYVVLA